MSVMLQDNGFYNASPVPKMSDFPVIKVVLIGCDASRISKPSPYASISAYSMPLCAIFKKWPEPVHFSFLLMSNALDK